MNLPEKENVAKKIKQAMKAIEEYKSEQEGGEFFTSTSVVRLMVEIIKPHNGTVYDPACGSAGMFVQSQNFVEQHHVTW